jgi:hypothetical protein
MDRMNQLGLHEGIRLTIPGIVLSLAGSLVVRSTVGIDTGIPAIAVIGVIVGITLAPASAPLHRRYFSALAKQHTFVPRVADIIRRKLVTASGHAAIGEEDAVELTRAYYASRYIEGELYSFRIGMSYGIMYYNLYLAFIAGGLSGLIISMEHSGLGTSIFAVCVVLAVSSRLAAKQHFLNSLDQELLFWKGQSVNSTSSAFAAIEPLIGLR